MRTTTAKSRSKTDAAEYQAADKYLTQVWQDETTPAEWTHLAKNKIKTAAQLLKDAATNLRLSKIKTNSRLAQRIDSLSRELDTTTA